MRRLNQLNSTLFQIKNNFAEYATETVENSTKVQKLNFTCAKYNALIIETVVHDG